MLEAVIRKNFILSQRLGRQMTGLLLFIFCFELLLFPLPIIAEESGAVANEWGSAADLPDNRLIEDVFNNYLPLNPDLEVAWDGYHQLTAYNSLVEQTNDQPCITANGFNLCQHWTEDTIAANFLKFGTKVRIPELFGDRVFIVRDRMNARYTQRVDVWMKHYENAIEFGLRYAKIEVLAD